MALGLVALGAGALSGSVAATPVVGGCQVFPAFAGAATAPSAANQTAWNQDVSQAPVRSNSDAIIDRIQRDGGHLLPPDFGSNPDYGIPFDVAPQAQPEVDVLIGSDGYPEESDFGVGTPGPDSAPIPQNAGIEAGSDHHALIVHQGECGLYELYRAKDLNDAQHRWQADSTALFDLGAAGPLRPDGFTSADAAGLPIMPGLVRYQEAAAGAVEHAIRITFDATRRAYVHPATHFASSSCRSSRPAMGMRLRLRRAYFNSHLPDFPPGSQSRAVFVALRHYGALVADNGSNWFITGETNPNWDDEDLDRLKAVSGRGFEVVKSAAAVTTPC